MVLLYFDADFAACLGGLGGAVCGFFWLVWFLLVVFEFCCIDLLCSLCLVDC